MKNTSHKNILNDIEPKIEPCTILNKARKAKGILDFNSLVPVCQIAIHKN